MKRSLKKRTAFGITCIAVILTVISVCVSYTIYARTMNSHYALVSQQIADTAVIGLNGDKIQEYYNSVQQVSPSDASYEAKMQAIIDTEYTQMLKYLHSVRKANNALYLYVEVFDFDRMEDIYIMDADEPEKALTLGYREILSEFMREHMYSLDQGFAPVFTNSSDYGPMVSSGRPIFNSSGEVVAVAMVDISMKQVWQDRYEYIIIIAIIMVILALILTASFVSISNRSIIFPINNLAYAASSYVSDKQNSVDGKSAIERLDIKTGDELENLCTSIQKMEHDIHNYIRNLTTVTAEKERIGAELDVATHIQASMLPSIFPAFPERTELDIYATMIPAKEVGGDFYDFFLVDDDHLAMVMADVSGKGVPAALFMVIAKTLIKNVAQTGLSPKAVLEKVNNQLCVNNEAEMFVTVWLGIYEISTGELICANAGHEYPALMREGGDYELIKDKHGFVLAGMEGSRYHEYTLQLNAGDRLFLYTDGVPEATDTSNTLFGTNRMLKSLNRSKNASCKDLLSAIKSDLDEFVGEASQFDDITMLALELRPHDDFGMKKITLPPVLESLPLAYGFVEETLEAAELPMKLIAQINIAIDEIFSNIILYSAATDATVGIKIESDCVTLRFADNGLPYDPTVKEDPDTTLSADERKIGGLGLYMVKKSMDSVVYEYHDGLNILTLKKKVL